MYIFRELGKVLNGGSKFKGTVEPRLTSLTLRWKLELPVEEFLICGLLILNNIK